MVAVLLLGTWLLLRDQRLHPDSELGIDQRTTPAANEVLTGHEKGGLAELHDDLVHARSTPPPYIAYLVDDSATRELLAMFGLAEGEVALVAGTLEEEAAAHATIGLMWMSVEMSAVSRDVQIIDLRQPSVRHGGGTSVLPGSTEGWAVWLREAELDGKEHATSRMDTLTMAESDQEMYSRWHAGQLAANAEP
jgi:hypothetical protein